MAQQPNVVRMLPTAAARADGWANVLTGLSHVERDKRLAASFEAETLTFEERAELHEGNDMAATIVDSVPAEALRQPLEVRLQGEGVTPEQSKDVSEQIFNRADEINLISETQTAWCMSRLHGGSLLFPGFDDGATDLGRPLELERVKSFDWVQVLTPEEVEAVGWYTDPLKDGPKYGEVKWWRLKPVSYGAIELGQRLETPIIHESRFIRFPGVPVTRRQRKRNGGWDNSVLTRVYAVLRDFGATWEAAAHLMTDYAQAVFKMKDLASIVGSEDENNIVKRAQIVDATRSIVRAIMIDKEEEFTRETTSLGGFPEMLQQFAIRLSAAARTPVSILMGQGNGGLNGPTSGANDTRWWYDATAAQQNTILRPRLNVLVRALFRAKNGPTKGVEPEKWRVHFPPLWQLSELEQADLRVKMSQADTAYVNAGILPPDTVARARFGGETYSIETHVDEDELTAFAEETAAEAEAQAANAAALERAAQAGAPPEAGAPKAGAPAEP